MEAYISEFHEILFIHRLVTWKGTIKPRDLTNDSYIRFRGRSLRGGGLLFRSGDGSDASDGVPSDVTAATSRCLSHVFASTRNALAFWTHSNVSMESQDASGCWVVFPVGNRALIGSVSCCGSGSSSWISNRLISSVMTCGCDESLLRRGSVPFCVAVRRRRCGLADLGRSWHDDIAAPCDNDNWPVIPLLLFTSYFRSIPLPPGLHLSCSCASSWASTIGHRSFNSSALLCRCCGDKICLPFLVLTWINIKESQSKGG